MLPFRPKPLQCHVSLFPHLRAPNYSVTIHSLDRPSMSLTLARARLGETLIQIDFSKNLFKSFQTQRNV